MNKIVLIVSLGLISGCMATTPPEIPQATFEAFHVKSEHHLIASGCVDSRLKRAPQFGASLIRVLEDGSGRASKRYTYYLDNKFDGVLAEIRVYPEASSDLGGLITRKFSSGNISNANRLHNFVRTVFTACISPYLRE